MYDFYILVWVCSINFMLEMFSRACKKSVIQNESTLNRLNAFPKYLGPLVKYAG